MSYKCYCGITSDLEGQATLDTGSNFQVPASVRVVQVVSQALYLAGIDSYRRPRSGLAGTKTTTREKYRTCIELQVRSGAKSDVRQQNMR